MEQNIGRYRWTICSLVFFATTINYLDRAVISLLKSTLTTELKWDDGDYTNVEIAFKISYAIGLLLAGRFIDTVGTKKDMHGPQVYGALRLFFMPLLKVYLDFLWRARLLV